MTWLADPSIWIGLFTLVVLEIVLGIDNLVFIAILVNKLPPAQRDRARMIGLGLALGMRVVLLMAMSWLIGLTAAADDRVGGSVGALDHPVAGRVLPAVQGYI